MVARLRDASQRSTTAAKPAATAVDAGTLYFDTDLGKLQRSSGTAWEDVEGTGVQDIAITGNWDVTGITGRIKIQTGAGVPSHTEAEGTLYWDTTNNKLYCNSDGAATWTDVAAAAAGGYATIQDEGGALTQRTIFNFLGPSVAAVDNAGATKTDITIKPQFKKTILSGNGSKTTTSTTFTAIDATNLPFLTLTLAVGDEVRCFLGGACKNSGLNGLVMFDFEVDQPTSANVRANETTESGASQWQAYVAGAVGPVAAMAHFIATEAGVHGFRPVWRVNANTGTLVNAATGLDDVAILFSVELLGPVTA